MVAAVTQAAPTWCPAICFDLDGVLIDTMPLHAQAWQEAARQHGLVAPVRLIYEWEGEVGTVTARSLFSRRGIKASQGQLAALLRDKEQRFSRLARDVRVIPRMVRLLDQLSRRGVPLALVTGTSSQEVKRVVSAALLKRFRAIITGSQVGQGKPHPEPYLKAFLRLRTRASRTVVIENAPYGIRAARRAGAGLVIAVASSLPKRYLHEAHVVVESAAQLSSCLDRLTAAC